jgi:glycosyltransferase involved in cell wall biosynthesis
MVPLVSLCTPTYNRREMIRQSIACYLAQDYPRDRMEWVVLDDGEDKVGDLFEGVPNVRYISIDGKLPLGKKRNMVHGMCKGEYLVYWDDDDYYFPTRVSHAVNTLETRKKMARRLQSVPVLLAGCTELYTFFPHTDELFCFGPYHAQHTTAGCMAFHRDLLSTCAYEDAAEKAEEKHFLKDYSIPMVQLDPLKTIICIAHPRNTIDKRFVVDQLLARSPDKVRKSSIKARKLFSPGARVFYTGLAHDGPAV